MPVEKPIYREEWMRAIAYDRGFAQKADWVGKWVPVLGTLVGLVRIVAGIALHAFYHLRAAYEKAHEKDNIDSFQKASLAKSEARRGLFELIPGGSWALDAEAADKEKEGILSVETAARGCCYYIDPEQQLHFSNESVLPSYRILWQQMVYKGPSFFGKTKEEGEFLGRAGTFFKPLPQNS